MHTYYTLRPLVECFSVYDFPNDHPIAASLRQPEYTKIQQTRAFWPVAKDTGPGGN